MLTVNAPAKLNLVLEVLGRREGYHDICSIAQTIDLCDTLTFEPSAGIEFTCSEAALIDDNLVPRAALLLRERCGRDLGARIHLEKRIPWGAGLGGGSSDAAATLHALNRLWDAKLSMDHLTALGARLGSDVPLFLLGGTVLLQGRGEQVNRLPAHPPAHAVVLLPDQPSPPSKTGLMYSRLLPAMFTRGQFVRAAEFALGNGQRVPDILMFNVFEHVASSVFPDIESRRRMFEQACGAPAHLAGSGPCLYALVDSAARAAEAATQVTRAGHQAIVAPFTRQPT
jgi:4-diphosphocytidyl-2-C-methyl-D-erythritol kinase